MLTLTAEQMKKKYGDSALRGFSSNKTKPGFVDRTKSSFGEGVGKIKTAVQESQAGRNPISTGAKAAAGAIEAVFSPVTAAAQPVIEPTIGRAMNYAVDKISDSSTVQKFAMSKAGERTARIAEDVGNVATIAGTAASFAGAPKVASTVSKTANEAATSLSSLADDTVATAKTKLETGLKSMFKGTPEKLRKENLRLTPTQIQKLGPKIDDVVDYLKKENIQGNPSEQFSQVTKRYNDFENTIQKTINDSGRVYPRSELMEFVKKIPEQYADEFDNPEIYNQLVNKSDSLVNYLQKNLPDQIPASKLNALKRAYAKNAWNKGGDAINNQASEAISNSLYTKLLDDVPTLEGLNKSYQTVITARKLLGKALGRNELGFIGRAVAHTAGGLVGSAVGGPIGGAAGLLLGPKIASKIAGTAARTRMAGFLEKVRPPSKP